MNGVGELVWPRQPPAHWSVTRLKWTISSCQNGVWGDEPSGDENDIICVRVADFDRQGDRVRDDDFTVRNVPAHQRVSRRVRRGDLLLEKSGGGEKQPVGKVVLYEHDEPAVCSNFVAAMRIPATFDARFLNYLHRALYDGRINVRSIKQNTGIQNLDSDAYLSERVALPPSGEQRAIADFLDRETGKIDALIAKQEELIATLESRNEACIISGVCGKLLHRGKTKPSGLPWLPDIPIHWDIVPLKSQYDFSKGRNSQQLTHEYISLHPGDYAVYSGQTENDGVMGSIDGYAYEIDQAIFTTTVGAKAMTPRIIGGRFSLSQNCMIITPKSASENIVFSYYAITQLFAYERRLIPTHMQPSFRVSDILKYFVPKPPAMEAQEISQQLRAAGTESNSLREQCHRLIETLHERRSALITAAVTGQITIAANIAAEAAA